jgi:hypothetical protein
MTQDRVIELASQLMETMPKTAGALLALAENCESVSQVQRGLQLLEKNAEIKAEMEKAGDLFSDIYSGVTGTVSNTAKGVYNATTPAGSYIGNALKPVLRGVGGGLTTLGGAGAFGLGAIASGASSLAGKLTGQGWGRPVVPPSKIEGAKVGPGGKVQAQPDLRYNWSDAGTTFGYNLMGYGADAMRAGASDVLDMPLQIFGLRSTDGPSAVMDMNKKNTDAMRPKTVANVQRPPDWLESGTGANIAETTGNWAPTVGAAALMAGGLTGGMTGGLLGRAGAGLFKPMNQTPILGNVFKIPGLRTVGKSNLGEFMRGSAYTTAGWTGLGSVAERLMSSPNDLTSEEIGQWGRTGFFTDENGQVNLELMKQFKSSMPRSLDDYKARIDEAIKDPAKFKELKESATRNGKALNAMLENPNVPDSLKTQLGLNHASEKIILASASAGEMPQDVLERFKNGQISNEDVLQAVNNNPDLLKMDYAKPGSGQQAFLTSNNFQQFLMWSGLTLGAIGLLNSVSGEGGLGSTVMAILGLGAAAYGAGAQGLLGESGNQFAGMVDNTLGNTQSMFGSQPAGSQTAMDVIKNPQTAQRIDSQLASHMGLRAPQDWSQFNQNVASGGMYANAIASQIKNDPQLRQTIDSLLASGQTEQALATLDQNSQLDRGALNAILKAYQGA